jgi:deazaflavin-dependent oxidoreductase (nitroreductase family)
MHMLPRLAYAVGLGPLIGGVILLLTTTGRRSGKPRVTPLQYEEIDGLIYLGAALGTHADWYRNILANPSVKLQVKSRIISGLARAITDPQQIADYLQTRLQHHPLMMRAILCSDGLRPPFTRADLEQYAGHLTLVVIQPEIT